MFALRFGRKYTVSLPPHLAIASHIDRNVNSIGVSFFFQKAERKASFISIESILLRARP